MENQRRVLIVDDERFNVKVLADLLKSDYKIMAAKSGEQALEISTAENPPDLILLDIMMPDMDGYEVCRRLKADEVTREIPVIFVSAMSDETDETKGLELGAVDYITKPVSPPIVQARVKTHMRLQQNLADLQSAHNIIEKQKKRMEDELNVGQKIQMDMIPLSFPAFPDRNELDIFGKLVPAREVGGDFYDFFFVDEDRFCFCIGDVSGKGVPAALFMAVTQTFIKSRASADQSTASIVTHINDELVKNNQEYMFVTLFIGILDVQTGKLIYTNGGHNPPYILQQNGEKTRLDARHGPVVGPIDGLAYKEDTTFLTEGDILLMYTDGVTEAMDHNQELFSEKRLVELMSTGEIQSPETLTNKVFKSVKSFEGEMDQADDITILVLQYLSKTKNGAQRLEIEISNQVEEIEKVKNLFDSFAAENKIIDTTRRKLDLVFDEILNNIISYGYQDKKEHLIQIKVDLSSERVLVSIMDDGMPFNPFIIKPPDTSLALEDREIGGLGIHLIKKSMDKVSYQRRIDKNVVTLVKNLRSTD